MSIRIDQMRHEILQMLSIDEAGFSEAIEDAVKGAVRDFDFKKEARVIVETSLKQSMTYAIQDAVRQAIKAPEVRKKIGEIVASEVDKWAEQGWP